MVIVWEKGSGLCNRLFVSAYGIALANAAGQRLVNLRLDDYEKLFPATNKISFLGSIRWGIYKVIRAIIRRLKRLSFVRGSFIRFSFDGENSTYYSPGNKKFIDEVKSRRFTFVEGWPYLEKMTFPETDVIRKTFTPSVKVLREVDDYVKKAKKDADVLVGVHIRRGDYEHHLNGRYHYSNEEYLGAMTKTAELLFPQKAAFLISSNGILKEDDFRPLSVTLGSGDLLGDLYGLARCDYLIGPPSTFSLWAAFYGRIPFYCLMTPVSPHSLSDFIVPDGHFECVRTVMDV